MPEAGLMHNQDLVRAESVPVRAPRRRVGDPLPGGGLYQLGERDEIWAKGVEIYPGWGSTKHGLANAK